MNRSRHCADPDLNTESLTRPRPTVQYLIHKWFTQFTGNTDVKKWFGAMEFTSVRSCVLIQTKQTGVSAKTNNNNETCKSPIHRIRQLRCL